MSRQGIEWQWEDSRGKCESQGDGNGTKSDLDEEVLLELVGSLLVCLALLAALNQGVQVEAQVTHLVAQVLPSLSPAPGHMATFTHSFILLRSWGQP